MPSSTSVKKRERRRKPDELLSSVVRETAIPAAVELLRSNDRFAFPNQTAWAALLLSAESIGGLSRRNGRDEAKGAMIELIESDQIHTVATAGMLENEVFGIIPTPETLDRMSEFSLLTKADYAWGVLWLDDAEQLNIEIAGEATFAQAQQVSSGAASLASAVGARVWSENGGVGDPTTPEATPDAVDLTGGPDDPDDELDEFDESAPDFGEGATDVDFGEDQPDFGEDGSLDSQPVYDEVDEAPEDSEGSEDGENEGIEEMSPEDLPIVSEERVQDTIARRFLAGDLGLEVDLNEFSRIFSVGEPTVQIETPEGVTGWLGGQIAQMSRQANAALAQMRSAHEQSLKTLYVDLMSQHAEKVQDHVSTQRADSPFKHMTDLARTAHLELRKTRDDQVREQQARIHEMFTANAKAEAERAATAAEARYRTNNAARLERDLFEAGVEVDRSIEATLAHDQQQIHNARRTAARAHFERGQSRINDILAQRQSEHLAAETALMEQWNADILRIVDDYRKADIARAASLAEEQSRTDRIGALQAEQAQALATLQAQHDERVRRMEDELERSRKDALAEMACRDAEWRHSLDLEKEKTSAESARSRDLMEQIGQMDLSFRTRYEARMIELEADKQSYADELQRASIIQSRSNRILTVLVIFIGLSMLVAGFIVGAAVMS